MMQKTFIFFLFAGTIASSPVFAGRGNPNLGKPVTAETKAAVLAGDPLTRANFKPNPFKNVCEGVVLLPQKSYEQDKAYWDAAQAQCLKDIPVQIMPDANWYGILQLELGKEKEQAAGADFLAKLGERTLASLDFNNMMSEVWMHCANLSDPKQAAAEKAWFGDRFKIGMQQNSSPENYKFLSELYDPSKCPSRIAELKKLINERGSTYRVNREVMKQTASGLDRVGQGAKSLMGNVADFFHFESPELPGDKVPLSDSEKARVEMAMKNSYLEEEVRKGVIKEASAASKILMDLSKKGLGAPDICNTMQPGYMEYYLKSCGEFDPDHLSPAASDALEMEVPIRKYQQLYSSAFEAYSQSLGEARILAFLETPNPSDADLAKAAAKLLDNGKKTKEHYASVARPKWRGNGRGSGKPPTDKEKIDDMQELMRNGAILRDVLREHPEDCAVAAGLVNLYSTQDGRNGALIGVGLVAGGIATAGAGPALFGAAGISVSGAALLSGVGAASAAVWVGHDYENFVRTKQDTFNIVHSDEGTFGAGVPLNDMEDYYAARDSFLLSVAMSTIPDSAVLGMFAKGGKGAAMLAKLVGEGKSSQLIKQLGSSTKSVAKSALQSIKDIFGITAAEEKLVQQAMAKHLFDPKDGYSKFLAALRNSADPKDQKAREILFNRMGAIMDKVTPGSTGSKPDAMRLVIAAAQLGQHDPKQLAGQALKMYQSQTEAVANAINSWDEGINGLTSAYEKARQNMDLPEIKALAPELQQRAAFKKALKDLGADDSDIDLMLKCGCGPV